MILSFILNISFQGWYLDSIKFYKSVKYKLSLLFHLGDYKGRIISYNGGIIRYHLWNFRLRANTTSSVEKWIESTMPQNIINFKKIHRLLFMDTIPG